MDVLALGPHLHLLRFAVGQAYLWRDGDALTLVDSGPPGSEEDVEEAIAGLGLPPAALRRIVLTHCHADHAGSAGALADRHGVRVLAHRADAAVLRGEAPLEPPDLAGAPAWERRLFDELHAPLGIGADDPRVPPPPPCPVHTELADGDTVDFGGGARVLWLPGHTAGSIALHVPAHAVVFTGDTAAGGPDGGAVPGVFHQDRARAAADLRVLARLEVETACFGHGEPVREGAAGALRQAAGSCG